MKLKTFLKVRDLIKMDSLELVSETEMPEHKIL